MDIAFLRPAFAASPVATVVIDTGKHDESGAHELQLRWRSLAENLEAAGAPEALVERCAEEIEALIEGTAPAGLVLVADGERLLLRHELIEPPTREAAVWGPLPHLAELVRQGSRTLSNIVVTVDRMGGVIRRYGPMSDDLGDIGVSGGDWPIKKVRAGGWSSLRYQNTVENTWEANVGEVAEVVNRLVQAAAPDLVVVAGDERARGLLTDQLSAAAKPLVRELTHPGDIEPTAEAVWEQVLEVAAERTTAVLDDVRRAVGQGSDGAAGLDEVCRALQRSQVDTLVLAESFLDGNAQVSVGEAETDVALSESVLAGDKGKMVPAVDGLLRAAAASDAQVAVAADSAVPGDGVAAKLRYADAATH